MNLVRRHEFGCNGVDRFLIEVSAARRTVTFSHGGRQSRHRLPFPTLRFIVDVFSSGERWRLEKVLLAVRTEHGDFAVTDIFPNVNKSGTICLGRSEFDVQAEDSYDAAHEAVRLFFDSAFEGKPNPEWLDAVDGDDWKVRAEKLLCGRELPDFDVNVSSYHGPKRNLGLG